MAMCWIVEPWLGAGSGVGAMQSLVYEASQKRSWRNIPTGKTTLLKSHNPLVLTNSSMTPLGKSALGINCAIESATCVGAAKSVAGARARISEMVFVKSIVVYEDVV
jgi:hypothetical protein